MNNYFGRSLKAVNLCWKQMDAEGVGAGRGRGRGRRRGVPENPPPPPPPPMTIEQLMGMQAMMNRMNNEPVAAPPPVQVRDKHGEFLKGRPPVFTHASDPLEADDWLKAVEKQLNIAQCSDLEKVLYASGQLQGPAQEWWESYQYGRPNNAPPVTWKEFTEGFRSHHILEGLIELKAEEFQSLK